MNDTGFNQPLIAVDVVPVMFDTDGTPYVFLAERAFAPHKGEYALPGVLLGGNESLHEAAMRALDTKIGFHADYMIDIGFFDNPTRDPRNKVVSVAFLAIINPGFWGDVHASNMKRNYHPLTSTMFTHDTNSDLAKAIPFDHYSIICKARTVLSKAFLNTAEHDMNHAIFEAMNGAGSGVTSHMVVNCANALGVPVSASNVARKLQNVPYIERGVPQVTGTRGKPPVTWDIKPLHNE